MKSPSLEKHCCDWLTSTPAKPAFIETVRPDVQVLKHLKHICIHRRELIFHLHMKTLTQRGRLPAFLHRAACEIS